MTSLRDATGQHWEIPANVQVIRNQDRYMKCTSCNATAAWLFNSTTATITRYYPVDYEPYEDADTKPAGTSACLRHVRINLKRAEEAQSRVQRFDIEARRWVVVESVES